MPPIKLPVYDRPYLDHSVLETCGRCPRLCYYNYRLNRASREESWPINYGSAFHDFKDSCETLYQEWIINEGKTLEEVGKLIYEVSLSVALKNWKDPPIEHTKSYLDRSRITRACELSFEQWKEEKALGYYKVIATESSFTLELPSGRLFAGRLDQILDWNTRLWIRDWKTLGRKPKGANFKRKFSPGHQFTGYTWAGQKLSGRKLEGVIIAIVYNIKTTGPEFYTCLANRSSGDIEHWLEWVEDEYSLFRRYEADDFWPMRTSACDDYGGCFFRECCDSGSWPSIEQWLVDNTTESHWDPVHPELEKGLPQ